MAALIAELITIDKSYESAIAHARVFQCTVRSTDTELFEAFKLPREGCLWDLLRELHPIDPTEIYKTINYESLDILRWLSSTQQLRYDVAIAHIDAHEWKKSFDWLVTNPNHLSRRHVEQSKFWARLPKLVPADLNYPGTISSGPQTFSGLNQFADSGNASVSTSNATPQKSLVKLKVSLSVALFQAFSDKSAPCIRELLKNPHVDIDAVCVMLEGVVLNAECASELINDERFDSASFPHLLVVATASGLKQEVSKMLLAMSPVTPQIEKVITRSMEASVKYRYPEILELLVNTQLGDIADAMRFARSADFPDAKLRDQFIVTLVSHKTFSIYQYYSLFVEATKSSNTELIALLNTKI